MHVCTTVENFCTLWVMLLVTDTTHINVILYNLKSNFVDIYENNAKKTTLFDIYTTSKRTTRKKILPYKIASMQSENSFS